MTKRTRRAIASRIEEIEGDGPAEWNVYSDVRVITDDMVDDRGNTKGSQESENDSPEPEPDTSRPNDREVREDGWELGNVVPTQSPVVTVHELERAESEET